jgi:hypothetical protein
MYGAGSEGEIFGGAGERVCHGDQHHYLGQPSE